MPRKLIVRKESFPLLNPFKIAHGTRTASEVIVVEIRENDKVGLGESVPYARYGESCESTIFQIESVRSAIENGATNLELQNLLPPSAARNALDCALLNLEAQKQDKKLWQILNLPEPKPLQTAYTLVINEPEEMAKEAISKKDQFPILKLKLAGDGKDMERILAVRNVAKDATMVLDANESWNEKIYHEAIEICQKAKIFMIEQPCKAGNDEFLRNVARPITICADESCHSAKDLENLAGKYDMINIKLDKAGGLTEAIIIAKKAREMNFKIMVGCMVGSSRAILPAYYLAQLADFVDLDAPLLLAKDFGLLKFEGNLVSEA